MYADCSDTDFENGPYLNGRNARCLLTAVRLVYSQPTGSTKRQRKESTAHILPVVCGFE